MNELLNHYPNTLSFLQTRFGVVLSELDRRSSLQDLTDKYLLPPPQILFMEIQLQKRIERVQTVKAQEAKRLLDSLPNLKVLDAREPWERAHGGLPRARPFDEKTAHELESWPRDIPVLVYCHFGVRSLDAAAYLADLGFTRVHSIRGGIDAWSAEVDASIERYSGSYC